ncbi:hypothetical protein C9374_007235 [Naegleria lovaniensis]|uniref:Endonuclease V n=1 Tax=Naegleria lovaniensis TaxID=51637 RepID=A0AA88GZX8_NAELO|nr:uncharacterized protein C9374_007235 [Naegleria lovaniensis]KAG2393704.1 hypothetical protein C9374_007235 [Naegleria lovaniensis]
MISTTTTSSCSASDQDASEDGVSDQVIMATMNKDMTEEELERIKQQWTVEQEELKKQLITQDDIDFDPDDLDGTLKFVGGVDISFDKENPVNAIASLIVLSLPDLKVVYEKYDKVVMQHPYIPGFLAFREVPHLESMVNDLRQNCPQFVPQVILVDGNGILHQRGFGLASHLGVVLNIPTIGVAKKLLYVDEITRETVKELVQKQLKAKGDHAKLVGKSGITHGVVFQPIQKTGRPLFLSIGHKISLESCIKVVLKTCIHKNPEPIRQADLRSRRMIEAQASENNKI